MRLVVQRVSRAAVRVGDRLISEIGPGLLVLAGVGTDDRAEEPAWLASKVFNLRIFEDDERKMNRSVGDTGGEVLVVAQFTLYGDARRGNRPSWAGAASAEVAQERIEWFAKTLESLGTQVRRGAFGEHMTVELENDGPVTILLDGRH